jgi:hypothetical protein
MLSRWRVSCAALILSVVACGGKSVEERIAEHDRVRVSWEQTARVTGALWIARTIPDAYAARTLRRASEELQSDSDALAKDELFPEARERLAHSLGAAHAFADTIGSAVRAGDRNAAARLVDDASRVNTDSLLRQAALQ